MKFQNGWSNTVNSGQRNWMIWEHFWKAKQKGQNQDPEKNQEGEINNHIIQHQKLIQ